MLGSKFRSISIGYGVFALMFVGIAAIWLEAAGWPSASEIANLWSVVSEGALFVVTGFAVSISLSISTWYFQRLSKALQYMSLGLGCLVAAVLLVNIVHKWWALAIGRIQPDPALGWIGVVSPSGLAVGYTYLAVMFVLAVVPYNKSLNTDAPKRRAG